MEIDVVCHTVSCNEEYIHTTAKDILCLLNLPDCELSIVICDDEFIHPLNRDYRAKDKPTDVLSFSQREGEFALVEDNVLGDVIISIETAKKQAVDKDHSLNQEMKILLVHGILHLLGYDHIEDDEAQAMQAKEREILIQL
jgi:probable rRNA maturation factor